MGKEDPVTVAALVGCSQRGDEAKTSDYDLNDE